MSITVYEYDERAALADEGPHIVWAPNRTGPTVRALLSLRIGKRPIASAELDGNRRKTLAAAHTAATLVEPWVPALSHLAQAVVIQRCSEAITFDVGILAYDWEPEYRMAVPIGGDPMDDTDAYLRARARAIREVLGVEELGDAALRRAAVARHKELARDADAACGKAAAVMPDMLTTKVPGIDWVGPYTMYEYATFLKRDRLEWYTYLPFNLLRGWKELAAHPEQMPWPSDETTDRRDALVRWALNEGVTKSRVWQASGIARSTIERIVREG